MAYHSGVSASASTRGTALCIHAVNNCGCHPWTHDAYLQELPYNVNLARLRLQQNTQPLRHPPLHVALRASGLHLARQDLDVAASDVGALSEEGTGVRPESVSHLAVDMGFAAALSRECVEDRVNGLVFVFDREPLQRLGLLVARHQGVPNAEEVGHGLDLVGLRVKRNEETNLC